MLLDKNYGLNILGRVSDIRNVFEELRTKISKLDLGHKVKISKPFKFLCSCTIRVSDIDFVVNGKGPNEIIALTSAYAELVERLSAFPESLHSSRGGMDLLRQPPNRRMLFGKIYDHSYLTGQVESREKQLPNPISVNSLLQNADFSKDQLDLIKEKSILTRIWIPAISVFEMDKVYQAPIHLVKLLNATNGLSAGSTLLEAIMHGVLEIFERYVLLKLFRDNMVVPTIDKTTIVDEYVVETLKYFEENGIEVVLKDLSMGFGIPAVGAITFNKELTPEDRGYNTIKVGVATTGRNAIMRALTERMQNTTFAEERMLGKINEEDKQFVLMKMLNTGKTYMDLTPWKKGETIPFKNWVYHTSDEVFSMIKTVLKQFNTKLFVIDYTHKILDFPVVQVIIPKLSDTTDLFVGEFRSLEQLGGVNEPLLNTERNLEKLYNTFF